MSRTRSPERPNASNAGGSPAATSGLPPSPPRPKKGLSTEPVSPSGFDPDSPLGVRATGQGPAASYGFGLFSAPQPHSFEKRVESLEEDHEDQAIARKFLALALRKASVQEFERTLGDILQEKAFMPLVRFARTKPGEKILKNPQLTTFWEKRLVRAAITFRRHRLHNQHDDLADQRHPFDILAGHVCYLRSRKFARNSKQRVYFLKLGATFGDYLCMDRLNKLAIAKIDEAGDRAEALDQKFIDKTVRYAKRAADLHHTAGHGLLAYTYFRLARYFHKRLLNERGKEAHEMLVEDNLLDIDPTDPNEKHRLSNKKIIFIPALPKDPNNYLPQRNVYYTSALMHLIVAMRLEPACEDISFNAAAGKNLLKTCSWTYDVNNLSELHDYLTGWITAVKLRRVVENITKEANDIVDEVLKKFCAEAFHVANLR